jgi:hypothetical protein
VARLAIWCSCADCSRMLPLPLLAVLYVHTNVPQSLMVSAQILLSCRPSLELTSFSYFTHPAD